MIEPIKNLCYLNKHFLIKTKKANIHFVIADFSKAKIMFEANLMEKFVIWIEVL
jgi:hypothetical protein